MKQATLRIARPTDHLRELVAQYQEGLGLERLGGFESHDGYDGVMLGCPGLPWHLEFTSNGDHMVGRAPTEDNLLVFYLEDSGEHQAACDRMVPAGFRAVPSLNSYWDKVGVTFEDVDGYRIVLVHGSWPPS
ncbi:MAG: VOC family protein [Planctomycetota bacterium]|nr:VOC family protein [Planctomycetota bacterium]MDG2142856.1 VOC family protein [Planctomycetota bacterium]